MAVWLGKEVARFVQQPPKIKINPNGVDLQISEIWRLPEKSTVIIAGSERKIIPEKIKVRPCGDFYILKRGTYEVRIANKVKIPLNAVGLLLPRSTFNRLGVIKSESAIWDSGYEGFGTQTIYVTVDELKVHVNEFWFQLMFIDTKKIVDQKYNGFYQHEKPLLR